MQKPLFSAAVASLLALAVCLIAPPTALAANSHGRSASDTYIVIQVMTKTQTSDGKTDYKKEYKAITSKSLRDEVKRAKDDYDEAKKEWKDELKSDPKTPRPVQWTPRKVSGSPIFETQKGAQEYADKLKEDDAKKDGDRISK